MTMRDGRSLAALGAVLLVVAAVFGRGLGFRATTMDDEALVFRNPVQRHFGLRELGDAFDPRASRLAYGLQYTPLRDVSYALDRRLFGDDPRPYHLQGLLLHALATVAVFVLVRRLGGDALGASAASLVFAIHPLQAEPVVWISGRTVPLAGALVLWALVAWRRARVAGDRLAYFGALALVLLANLSKQSAVVTLALLAVVEWTAVGRMRRGALRAYAAPAVLCLAFTGLGLWIGRREGIVAPYTRDPGEQLRLSLAAFDWYARAFVRPVDLLPAYDLEPPAAWNARAVLGGVGVLTALGTGVALAARRWPLLALGLCMAAVALVPGVHGLGTQVVADRYAYVALAGMGLVAAALGDHLARRAPRAALALVAVLAVPLGSATAARVGVWRDDVALFGDAAATAPQNPLWQHLLGRALADAGRTVDGDAAVLEARIRRGDGPVAGFCPLPPVLAELGLQREREGDETGAEEAFAAALEHARPGEVDRAAVDLGAFYLRRGDRERARLAYLRAVEREGQAARLSSYRLAWLDAMADAGHN